MLTSRSGRLSITFLGVSAGFIIKSVKCNFCESPAEWKIYDDSQLPPLECIATVCSLCAIGMQGRMIGIDEFPTSRGPSSSILSRRRRPL